MSFTTLPDVEYDCSTSAISSLVMSFGPNAVGRSRPGSDRMLSKLVSACSMNQCPFSAPMTPFATQSFERSLS